MTLEKKVDIALTHIKAIQANIELHGQMLRAILEELGIRGKLQSLADKMEAHDSAYPPTGLGNGGEP